VPGTTKFQLGAIRTAGSEARPASAGVWWLEGTRERRNRVPAGWLFLVIGVVLIIAGFALTGQYGPFALALVFWGALPGLAGPVMLLSGSTPRRELVFSSGRTLTPLGTHSDRAGDWPDLPPSRIARIELGKGDLGVFALDVDGGYRLIADRLNEDESRAVAAELSRALEEARAA
jgi:hypothetical protein